MGRNRIYANATERSRAYRQRVKAEEEAEKPVTLQNLANDIHEILKEIADNGSLTLALIVGEDEVETLRNLKAHLYAFKSPHFGREQAAMLSFLKQF